MPRCSRAQTWLKPAGTQWTRCWTCGRRFHRAGSPTMPPEPGAPKKLTNCCGAMSGSGGQSNDSRELASQLKLGTVGLINDLEAYAYGIDALESKDLVTLSEGVEDAEGNRVVISARTGLGVAGLYWDGFRHHPFPCEGGHADFAPKNDLEAELAKYLRTKHDHVSCERILSGPGIKNIYDFLRDTGKAEEPGWLQNQISEAPDPPALISQLALENKAPICDQTMKIFVGVYGSETGNCALNFMATGGVFIGGSIAAKIVPRMQDPVFMNSFLDKGRMRTLLADMPVKIVMND